MLVVAKSAPIQPIDPRHPQPRHIQRAVGVLQEGGIVSYPTDTYYALGCDVFQKKAMQRLASLKRRDDRKPFAFLCADLGEVAKYGIVSNESYRLMRRILPGPYTIIIDRRDVNNLRTVAQLPITGILGTTGRLVGNLLYVSERGGGTGVAIVDVSNPLTLNGGVTLNEQSTVLDLTGPAPVVLREGKGRVEGVVT